MGELWAAPLVAAVVLAQVQLTALVWLKFVVNPAMARVRLAVGLIRADQALLPPLAGVAHAPVPLPRLVTPRFPVTPPLPLAARLIAGISAPTRARKVGAAAPPLEGP